MQGFFPSCIRAAHCSPEVILRASPPGAEFIFSFVCASWEKSARFAAESQPLPRLGEPIDALADAFLVMNSDPNKGATGPARPSNSTSLDLYRSRCDQRQRTTGLDARRSKGAIPRRLWIWR